MPPNVLRTEPLSPQLAPSISQSVGLLVFLPAIHTCYVLPPTSGIHATSSSHGLAMSPDALLDTEPLSHQLAPSTSHDIVCLVFITAIQYLLLQVSMLLCYLK